MIRSIGTAAAAVLLLSAPALGQEGMDRDAIIAAMMSEGATEAQATCFVDALGEDVERLITAEDDDLSEEDQELIMGALMECDGGG